MVKVINKVSKSENNSFKKLLEFLKDVLVNPKYLIYTCVLLLILEVVINILVIENVKYTEIDWIAYMQEVEGFLNGTLDYKDLKGDTGPLVYPAGFVYIYSLFYFITSFGKDIYLAQYIFLLIYILQLCLTFRIYLKTEKVPPYALAITTLTSYRIHSIYVLRLFNDPIAVLLFYVSLNLYISNKWLLGSLFYSLAVSVKMNILLYAPCLLLAFLTNLELSQVFLNLFICAVVQLILGAPFMYTNLFNYIKGSFDLGRVFEHKWTVNYRFLPIEIFENRIFHVSLLLLHLILLLIFLKNMIRYLSNYAKLNYVFQELKARSNIKPKKQGKKNPKNSTNDSNKDELSNQQKHFLKMYENQLKSRNSKKTPQKVTPTEKSNDDIDKIEINFGKMTQLFVLPFFVTNLIGIACARSLHYQFYCWYFHSLLYLVHCTGFSKITMFLILGIIEYCWNVYPSTVFSSSVLHITHIILLFSVYRYMSK